MLKKILAGAIVATSMASVTQAADSGFYLVADVGYGEARDIGVDRSEIDNELNFLFASSGLGVLNPKSSLDESDTTFSVGGGYSFNRYFAVELAYVDLGEIGYTASGTLTDGFNFEDASISATIEAYGIALSAVGTYPVTDQFAVYAKAGVIFSDTEATAKFSAAGQTFSESYDDTDEDYQLGLGVQYALTSLWSVTAEYARIFDLGPDDDTIGESDYDRFTVGLKYRF